MKFIQFVKYNKIIVTVYLPYKPEYKDVFEEYDKQEENKNYIYLRKVNYRVGKLKKNNKEFWYATFDIITNK